MVLSGPKLAKATPITTTTQTQQISDGVARVTVATAFGPRITGFSLLDGENVLADLGDLGIDLPDGRAYTLRGGHRLWAAPEIPEVTYEPDDDPIAVVRSDRSLTLQCPASEDVGIAKTIAITLVAGRVTLAHTLANEGSATIDIAPWAITQLPPGGTAVIPLPQDPADPHGLLPNGKIVVWPYTGVDDSPFTMRDRLLLLEGTRTTATKIGTTLERGWLAYARNGLVFVKRGTHQVGGRYLDFEASAQCYCNPDFVELETLGPQTPLAPGDSTTHTETWELHRIDSSTPSHEIPELLNLDGGT